MGLGIGRAGQSLKKLGGGSSLFYFFLFAAEQARLLVVRGCFIFMEVGKDEGFLQKLKCGQVRE